MGDTDTTAHEEVDDTSDDGDTTDQESTTEDDADTSQNTDADDADDDTEGDDDAEDGDDADSKGDSDDTSSSDAADSDDTTDEDDGAEPELRKPKAGASNAEWAAWRKQEAARKAKSEKSGKSADAEDTSDEDDDDDLSPEEAAKIDKRIAKAMQPFQQQAVEQEVDTEIASFLNNNPDFKPFAAKAKRFAMHPSRQNVPVKSIFFEVAGDKLLAIGAKRRAAADAKARKTKTGGGNASDAVGSKSYKDMPLSDFGKELDAVKSAPRSR